MLRPDKEDPMKVRRCLAFFVSIYAFLVLPNLLVAYQISMFLKLKRLLFG